jgi:excisionase family DNA binding protein
MADRIAVPLPDGRWLALTPETLREALEAGSALMTPQNGNALRTDEPLVDSDELATLLKVPAGWFEQKAREGVIPSLEFGRWRRFRRSEVESAVRASREH